MTDEPLAPGDRPEYAVDDGPHEWAPRFGSLIDTVSKERSSKGDYKGGDFI